MADVRQERSLRLDPPGNLAGFIDTEVRGMFFPSQGIDDKCLDTSKNIQ